LGSSKKLDLEEEIDLESDMNMGDVDDDGDLDACIASGGQNKVWVNVWIIGR